MLRLSDIDNVTMFNLDDYELFSQPSQCCAHGGLIIYVHKQFAGNALTNMKVQSTGWEYLCVQYILCNIYRKPNEIVDDINIFTNELSSLLVKVKNLKHSSYLCGDYNIDLLKVKTNRHYCSYLTMLYQMDFFQKLHFQLVYPITQVR